MINKRIEATIKLQIGAGKANPSPPIGPALGQHGLNIMEFCKNFNIKTQNIELGIPIPVEIFVYNDRSYTFKIKTPPASYLIKKMINIKSGSSKSSKEFIGAITIKQLEDIAKIKNNDLTAATLSSAIKIIAGTARSMGIKIEDNND